MGIIEIMRKLSTNIYSILIPIALFIFTLATKTYAKPKIFYSPRFYSQVMNDQQTKAKIFGTGIHLKSSAKIHPSLKVRVRGAFRLESGSNNSLNLKEFSPISTVILEEAAFKYNPESFNWFRASIGSLPMTEFNSPLLIDHYAFMGVQEKLVFGEDFKLKIGALQTIPNNQSLSSRSGGIEEGTPTFFMETLGLFIPGDLLGVKVEVSHFKFNQLSGSVANQSRFMGNDIGGTALTSFFLYDFEGFNSTFRLTINESGQIGVNFFGQYLFNDKAPDNQNTGFLGRADLVISHFTLGVSFFRNEKNASPGYYNSKYFGHNNKEGFALNMEFKKLVDKFSLDLRFAKFEQIEESNLLTSEGQLFTLNFTREFHSW